MVDIKIIEAFDALSKKLGKFFGGNYSLTKKSVEGEDKSILTVTIIDDETKKKAAECTLRLFDSSPDEEKDDDED